MRFALGLLAVAGTFSAAMATLVGVAICWQAVQEGLPPSSIAALVLVFGAIAACLWAALYIAFRTNRHA